MGLILRRSGNLQAIPGHYTACKAFLAACGVAIWLELRVSSATTDYVALSTRVIRSGRVVNNQIDMDIFYLNQSKALAELHAASITLSAKLYNARKAESVALHANELYDPNEGNRMIVEFVLLAKGKEKVLGHARVMRILRNRNASEWKRQLDYDISRAEALQGNIEHEIDLLWKASLLAYSMISLGIALLAYVAMLWLVAKALLWRGIL